MTLTAKPPGRMSLGALLLGSGPRFARDALGPVLAFYAVWKFWGLLAGIVAGTLVGSPPVTMPRTTPNNPGPHFLPAGSEERQAGSGQWLRK
jgi:hypothetical protein